MTDIEMIIVICIYPFSTIVSPIFLTFWVIYKISNYLVINHFFFLINLNIKLLDFSKFFEIRKTLYDI